MEIQAQASAKTFCNQNYVLFTNEGINRSELIQIIDHLFQNLGSSIEAKLLLIQSGRTVSCSTYNICKEDNSTSSLNKWL